MKKIVSLLLAVMMAFSVMSAASATVFAKTVFEFENSSVKSVEFSFDKKTVVENTNGFWDTDENGEKFFHYFIGFDKGDVAVFTMADGTKHTYTYKEKVKYDYETGYYFDSFSDENGKELTGTTKYDDQAQNHWGVGSHIYRLDFNTYGVVCDIPVDIIKMPFADLGNYEYYNTFIAYTSIYNEFLKGTNPPVFTEFSPTTSITRAMFVTILYRMAGEPYANSNPYSSSPFTDIKNTSVYYYDAACWALDEGITNQTTFKPFDNVTREQTASFLFRYAKGIDSLGSDEYKNVDLTKYSDNKNISRWAAEAMQWANYNSMITGTQQGTANPQGATQRIHATKILYGFGKTCNIGNFE